MVLSVKLYSSCKMINTQFKSVPASHFLGAFIHHC